MILVDPPEAPFEIIYDADTSDTLLNIVPPAGSQRMYLNAHDDILDGWNKKKQTGSHTVWSTRNSDYDTGVVGTLRVLNEVSDGIYLTNVDGSKKGLHLLPDGISVDKDAHSITEEFVIQNDGAGMGVTVIDPLTSDWTEGYATDGTITYDNGVITNTDSVCDASGRSVLMKSIGLGFLLGKTFIKFTIMSNTDASLYCLIVNPGSSTYKMWSGSRFQLAANTWKTFVLPVSAPVASTGANPSSLYEQGGTFDLNYISRLYIGVEVSEGATVSYSVTDVKSCNGTWAKVEVAVPDTLSVWSNPSSNAYNRQKVKAYVHNGTDYVLACYDSSTNYYWRGDLTVCGDGSRFQDIYNEADYYVAHAAMYKIGDKQSLATCALSSYLDYGKPPLTYSSNAGTSKRIGFAILMPPSDNGRTNLNKCRLKLVTYYDDENGNMVPDLSGKGNHGTIVGGVTKLNEGGLQFDGSTGYVNCGSIANYLTQFSMCIKLKTTNLTTTQDVAGRGSSTTKQWLFRKNANNTFSLFISADGTNTSDNLTTVQAINDTGYHNVIVTFNAGLITITVDGVSVSKQSAVTSFSSQTAILTLAKSQWGGFFLQGDIFEYLHYNRELSQSEITAYTSNQSMSQTGLVVRYSPTVSNMGSTTFEFTPQSLDHFTGLDNVGNWIAFERPDKRAEVFLFSRKLPSLSVTEDENGYITNIEVGVKKGTRVARAWIRYPDFDADGNSDDVPNFIDKIVEQLQNKFAFTRKYTNEVDLSGMAVVANDFSIDLQTANPVYPVSSGSKVYDSQGNLLTPVETITTADGNLDLVEVYGKSSIRVFGDENLNYGECKVFDTVTPGNTVENTWKRVYDPTWVFTGDIVMQNGLYRLICDYANTSIYVYRYTGESYVKIYGTGTTLATLVYNGTDTVSPTYKNFIITSITADCIIFSEMCGCTSITENEVKYSLKRAMGIEATVIVNTNLRYVMLKADTATRSFYIIDGTLYDSAITAGFASVATTTGVGCRIDPVDNSIVYCAVSTGNIYLFRPINIGSIFPAGKLLDSRFGAIPYSQQMYWEAESLTGYGKTVVSDVDTYSGQAVEIRRPADLQNYIVVNLTGMCVANQKIKIYVRAKCTLADKLQLYVHSTSSGIIMASAYPVLTIGSYAYYSLEFTPLSIDLGKGVNFYLKNMCDTGAEYPITVDYIVAVPTGLIEKHAKRALADLSAVTTTYKEL